MTRYSAQLQRQRDYFLTGATRPLAAREETLRRLGAAVASRQEDFIAALRADLGKCEGESRMLELGPVLDGLHYTLEHLREWTRPEEPPSPPPLQPGICRIYREPLGLTLILAPWNYPLQLSFLPLLTSLSAGNCVVLKPSPDTPRVVEVMRECLACLPEEETLLVAGGVAEATELLRERFDAILYTGNARGGKIVMEAAARHLTPVCLELGGKSPVLVAKDAALPLAAKRIAWGKMLNAGQTCIAPDYALVDKTIREPFIRLVNEAFAGMLGADPLLSPDYAQIVSEAAFNRLMDMAPARARADRRLRKIAPLAFAAEKDHPLMEEEIFGPFLPVLAFDQPEQALDFVRAGEKPLAFYLFTEDEALASRALERVSSGGACVNDVILYAAAAAMPFGGVGTSGMGRYHGKYGFDFFSNIKSVLHQSSTVDMPLRYPPFSGEKLALLRGGPA
ncbi:MAG: aldehyde dehydrogenase family protein [Desulfovibrio sp.]|jgi:aldehyde dehydrogenase (NAD+)|nr:aldehyde dehydrogenase family protein [Desulfovibrio sp.]